MALADRPTRRNLPGTPCRIGEYLAKMPADDRDTLLAWLADETIQGSVIARNLTAEGYKTSGDTLRHHRNGDCSCGAR